MRKLVRISRSYYDDLDAKARNLAGRLISDRPISKLLLVYIGELYEGARIQDTYSEHGFEAAYHNPVTSDFEFLLSRILFHCESWMCLGWKIYLRRQVNRVAPDIRVEIDGKTIAVFEIKSKVGWAQAAYSKQRFDFEKESGKTPEDTVAKVKQQLDRYQKAYDLSRDRIFMVVPSLHEAHRKKFKENTWETYVEDFCESVKFKKENFLLLSQSLDLNLSERTERKNLHASDLLEQGIRSLFKGAKPLPQKR